VIIEFSIFKMLKTS